MPVGLQVFGDAGQVQIDSDYRCLRQINQGQVALDRVWSNGYVNSVQMGYWMTNNQPLRVVSAAYPIVAFRSGRATMMMTIPQGNNTYDFYFQVQGLTSPVALTLDFWVFAELPPVASNIGMQIFKDDGSLVFDSNDKAAKIMDFFTNAWPSTGGVQVMWPTKTYPHGAFAVAPNSWSTATRYTTQGSTIQITNGSACSTSGNQLITGVYTPVNQNIGSIPPSGKAWGNNSILYPGYLVLDVSGY